MTRSMDKIVALCKRRGFIFQNSEIYGGQNGFWDYGPLGTELKRNVRDVWYHDMVSAHNELLQPAGAPATFQMVGLESAVDHAPAGLEMFRPLRSVSRHDGGLPYLQRTISSGPYSQHTVPAEAQQNGRRAHRLQTDGTPRIQPDDENNPRRDGHGRRCRVSASGDSSGDFCEFQERRATAVASNCRSESARSARAFATKSRLAISRFVRANSSRWKSNSSAIRHSHANGTRTGAIDGTTGI